MILHRYFALRFLRSLGMVLAVFLVLLTFLDLIEQLRAFSGSSAPFGDILALTLLNLPQSIYRIFPLIVILATITLFLGLARSSEMVITRAAGRSALRSLMSPVLVMLTLGAVGVAVLNPIVAATMVEYEARAGAIRGDTTTLAIAQDGLWLRQGNANQQTVIRAKAANLDGTSLSGVSFFSFAIEGGPVRRVEAESADLVENAWKITNAKVWPFGTSNNPEMVAAEYASYELPSSLTADQIRDSFGTPASIPIWELPQFVERLEQAGFSARRHKVWFQTEIAQPFFLVAMVLIGAVFTMRHQRGGKTGVMVLWAILLSFGLYFVRNFAIILGENGQIPVMMAAWVPPLGAIGLALGFLLHLEDG
jgi:lipopolysaccharide export system permease protein